MMKSRINPIVFFLIYFIVNFLFLTKYGIRQDKIPLSVLCIGFIGVNFLIFYISKKHFLIQKLNTKSVYILTAVISLIYLVFCHLLNDPVKLNIDRWETLQYSTDYWIHGKFFYDKINFLGNKSSYLPGQLLLALPFYLLNNVGYLQIAAFLLFSYAVSKQFRSSYLRFLAILMFGISLAYIYETICKSDFISSFIVSASFIAIWDMKFKDNYFKKPYLLGIILGVICLTRSVAVLPLIIFLLKPFLDTDIRSKLKVIVAFASTVSILLATVVIPVENFSDLITHNPLNLQGQSSTFVMILFLALSVLMSFYVRKIADVFYYSSVIVFFVMISFLIQQYLRLNFDYQNNFFSTTYLAACLPFSIIAYCFSVQRETMEN